MSKRTIRSFFILMPVLLIGSGVVLVPRLQSAPAPSNSKRSTDAFMRENMVAMDRMMSGMHGPPSGDVDRDFTNMMIPHHQGAVDMALLLLRYGKNKELKTLARQIIAKQRQEIAIMRRISGKQASATPPAEHHHAMH